MSKWLHLCILVGCVLITASCDEKTETATSGLTSPGTAFNAADVNAKIMLSLSGSNGAGSIPGSFDVDANGAANYHIPLNIPSGTNGVTPDISLIYNSNQRNGLVGIGWNIGGLHSIARCGRSIAQDGIPGTISYEKTDRFCIDGQRLIAFKNAQGDLLPTYAERAAAYGQEGTQYRTERETWSEISSSGQCGSGPCSFNVQTKDGTTLLFGSTSDSRVLALGRSDVRVWAQSKSADRRGNYVSAAYDQVEGAYRITEITYTGNDRVEVSPQRLIQFSYETRDDPIYANVGGSSVTQNQVLVDIATYLDADGDNIAAIENLVTHYKINYIKSDTTEDNVVNSIEHCDAAGVCLPATTFNYTEVEKGLSAAQTSPIPSEVFASFATLSAKVIPADYDGNGITDFSAFQRGLTTLPIMMGQPNGTFIGLNNTIPDDLAQYFNGSSPTQYSGDFNADGNFDIAVFGKSYTSLPILFSNGDGTFRGSNAAFPTGYDALFNVDNAKRFSGDFNGDGRTDFAVFKNGYSSIPVILSNGDGTFRGVNVSLPAVDIALFTISGVQIVAADINGDGMTDFSAFKSGYSTLPIYLSNGQGGFNFANNNYPQSYQALFTTTGTTVEQGDFNSDGLTDFAAFRSGVNSQPVLFSLGNGTFFGVNNDLPTNIQGKFAGPDVQRVSGDYNGDGLSDIAAFKQNWPTVPIMYSLGDGTFNSTNNALESGYEQRVNGGAVQRQMGDFNGDGLFDLLVFQKSQTDVAILFTNKISPAQAHSDLVDTITTGAGAVTQLTYLPITSETTYSVGTEATVYPEASAQRALFVVASHTTSSHANDQNPNTFKHYYKGAVFDWTRGWQGFRVTTVDDIGLGHRTIMNYHMSFPLTGKVSRSQTTQISDTALLMSKQSITYGTEEVSGIYTVWAESVETEHYTNGNYNFTIKNDYTYDAEHKNLIVDANLGDVSDPSDDIISCIQYFSKSGAPWWTNSFPAQNKQVTSSSGCNNWSQWVQGTDISWMQYEYNEVMDVVAQKSWWDTENSWVTQQASYDYFGNVLTTTDANSAVSTYTYDTQYSTFLEQQISPPLGSQDVRNLVVQTTYDPRFNDVLINLIDPNGNNTYKVPDGGLDGFGRVLEVQSVTPTSSTLETVLTNSIENIPEGILHTVNYRLSWDQNVPEDQWGWSKSYYDGYGRNYRIDTPGYADGITLITEHQFDAAGRPITDYLPYYVDAKQCVRYSPLDNCQNTKRTMTYAYDGSGHLSLITTADGSQTHFVYKPTDDRIVDKISPSPAAPIDGDQTVTETRTQNALGLTISEKNALDGVTTYSYDRLRRLHQLTDPVNSTRTMTFDSLNNLILLQTTGSGATTYNYTTTGLVSEITDADNRKQKFTYDLLERIKTRELFLPGVKTPEQTDTYVYDEINFPNALGNLSSITLPHATYRYKYNNINHISEQTVELAVGNNSQAESFNLAYTHDPMGRQLSVQTPEGDLTEFNYSVSGLLNTVGRKPAGEDNFITQGTYGDYNSYGKASRVEYANGVVNVRTWDIMGKVNSRLVNKGAMVYVNEGYQRNKAQKILTITNALGEGEGQTLSYDKLGQLVSAEGVYGSIDYAYNPTGDVTKKGTTGFLYDSNKPHQLVSACTLSAGQTSCGNNPSLFQINYDLSGHELKRTYEDGSVRDYSLNGASEIVGVTQTNSQGEQSTSIFTYDAGGIRITKTEPLGTTSYYISPEYDVLFVAAQNGDTARTVKTNYVNGVEGAIAAYSSGTNCPSSSNSSSGSFAPGCNGAGNPKAGEKVFFSDNEVGSIDLVTDVNGANNSVTDVAYEPFGALASASEGVDNFRPKFTKKELDANTELYYFGSRYFDPELGRFISPDPAYQYHSPYVYGANDPFSGIDPDGEFFGVDDAVVIAVAAAAVGAYAGGSIANHSMNPVSWKWGSTDTWVGLFAGGASGVAVAATGGAALAGLGVVAPEAVAIGGMSAGSVASLSSDIAFVVYDADQFGKDPSVSNGIFLALDVVPYASMLGKSAKSAARGGRSTEEAVDLGRAGKLESSTLKEAEQSSDMAHVEEGCHSFTAGTLVKGETDYISVENIQVGDLVWAYDETQQELTLSPVAQIVQHEVDDLFEVTLADETIETTAGHLFYSEGKWVAAKDLKPGQLLQNSNGGSVPVVSTKALDNVATVYNFEVNAIHSYYVSPNEVLVHNVNAKCLAKKGKKRPSWKSGAAKSRRRVAMHHGQIDKYGNVTSSVKLVGKAKKVFKLSHKISIGSKGRLRSVWDIDHVIPYRFLLWAAKNSKKVVTWKDMRAISNDVTNLRLMTMSENVSHGFEPSVKQGQAGAIKIFKKHNKW